MFSQICPGCGEEFIPIPGMDSGHGNCPGSGRNRGMVDAYEWAEEDVNEDA